MTFILSEDLALKQRLQGMTVTDGSSASRSVGVWFGQPDKEIQAQDFPFIIINLIRPGRATERMHSDNPVRLPYLTPPVDLDPGQDILYNRPIPINLDYQVSSYSRHPRHDRSLLAQMMHRLPMRGGLIAVTHDKEDEATARRLDFLSLNKRDRIEDNKRLLINDFTVRISSETDPDTYRILVAPPTSLEVTVGGSIAPSDELSPWGPNPGPPDPEDPDVPLNVETGSTTTSYPFGT